MEHKEGKTGVEALKSQQSPPASSLPIAGDVRKNAWDRIRAGGKIDLIDIAGVGVATRRKFEESGFWSPSDFFKAYTDGRVEELAALADDLHITKGGSGADVIAGEVVSAPEAHMTMDKNEVTKNIKSAKPGVPFLDRRATEIKDYLEKIGFVENRPVVISLVNRGEKLTHEAAAEAEAVPPTSPASRAGPVTVMIGQKAVRGMGDLKKKAKDAVFDRAMRDAMTGMGGKFGVGLERFFENVAKVSPKLAADEKLMAKAKSGFVKNVTTDFILNKTLVQDPDIGQRGNLRPSDSEMARYLFASRAEFRIGETNNFDIPRIAKFAAAGQSILKNPGELVFEDPSKTGNIRLTGHVLVKSKKDVDKLVKILGTNPKNGFAPIGFEATDDAAKMAMDTFTVFARYVGGSNIVTPNVVDVSKVSGNYVITVDDGKKIMHGADVHLWAYKPKEELAPWAAKKLDETATDVFGKKYDDLTPSERESVIGSSEVVPALFATNHEYAGSLCEVDPGSKTIERLRAVDKLLNQFYFTGKSKEEKAAVGFVQAKIGEIKDGINGASGTKGLVEKLGDINKADIGTLNTGSKPNCLVVPSFDKANGKIDVVTGADSKFVERKLDKAIAICSKLPSKFEKEGCFADWIVVSQNFTDGGAMDGKVYRAIEKSKTVLEQKGEADTEKVLLSIARKMAAGSWNEEKDPATNRTVDIKPDTKEKRDVLNAVKLLGNQPLGITPWKFLSYL
jgi:hypothetical protein